MHPHAVRYEPSARIDGPREAYPLIAGAVGELRHQSSLSQPGKRVETMFVGVVRRALRL